MVFKRQFYSKKGGMENSTIENNICPIVGPLKDLSEYVLPTGSDILQYYAFLKLKNKSVGPNLILETVLNEAEDKIRKIWISANVTIVSKQRVKYLLVKLHSEVRDMLKSIRLIKKDSYKTKLENFKCRMEQLFDIAICKCGMEKKCHCPKEVKV